MRTNIGRFIIISFQHFLLEKIINMNIRLQNKKMIEFSIFICIIVYVFVYLQAE